jgi:hypothetical protein
VVEVAGLSGVEMAPVCEDLGVQLMSMQQNIQALLMEQQSIIDVIADGERAPPASENSSPSPLRGYTAISGISNDDDDLPSPCHLLLGKTALEDLEETKDLGCLSKLPAKYNDRMNKPWEKHRAGSNEALIEAALLAASENPADNSGRCFHGGNVGRGFPAMM